MGEKIIVTVELSYPFNELVSQDKLNIELKQPILAREFVRLLIDTYPDLSRPLEKNENGEVSVLLLKGAVLLSMQEEIAEECRIRLMLPLSGG